MKFYDPCKSVLQMVQMLKNTCECLRMPLRILRMWTRMKRENDAWVTNLHNTHCRCFSLSNICQPLSNELNSLFSIKFVLIVHIRPAFYGNVNTNASESLQMSYDHYKCLAKNKNGLRMVTNCVANMLS